MVRAAEAAGLAGFAFTEHVFHLDEAARGEPLSRHALGRRARGPADRRRALPERDRRGRRGRAGGRGDGRPRARALAGRSARARGAGRLRGRARRRLGHRARLGALPDAATTRSSIRRCRSRRAEAWDDYLERLARRRRARRLRRRHAPGAARGQPARACPPISPSGSTALAELAAASDTALEVNGSDMRVYPELVQLLCESIARAGAPVSLGSDAHYPRRVGAVLGGIEFLRAAGVRQRGRVRAPPPARRPAVTPRRRARRSRCSGSAMTRVRRLVPADGRRAARLRARPPRRSCACSPAPRVLAVAARGTLRQAARLGAAHRGRRGVRPRHPVVAAGVRDDARRRRAAGARARASSRS